MALYSTERALIIIKDLQDISEHFNEQATWNDVYYAFLEVFPSDFIEKNFNEIKGYLTEYECVTLDHM